MPACPESDVMHRVRGGVRLGCGLTAAVLLLLPHAFKVRYCCAVLTPQLAFVTLFVRAPSLLSLSPAELSLFPGILVP